MVSRLCENELGLWCFFLVMLNEISLVRCVSRLLGSVLIYFVFLGVGNISVNNVDSLWWFGVGGISDELICLNSVLKKFECMGMFVLYSSEMLLYLCRMLCRMCVVCVFYVGLWLSMWNR